MSQKTLRPMAAAAGVDPSRQETEPAPPPVLRSQVRTVRPRKRRRRGQSGLLKIIQTVLADVG